MSEDLIKRSDAIEVLRKLGHEVVVIDKVCSLGVAGEFIDAIRTIPSADRPQGEWIKHDEERDYCSCCKHIFKTRTITKQDKWTNYIDDLGYNYCPNCGARMKGADDYERAIEQMEHDMLYEPTYNSEDGSM